MKVNCIRWIKKRRLDGSECNIWNFHRKPVLLNDGRMGVLNTHGKNYPLRLDRNTGEFYISMADNYYLEADPIESEEERDRLLDELRMAEEREVELSIKLLLEFRANKVFIEQASFSKGIN